MKVEVLEDMEEDECIRNHMNGQQARSWVQSEPPIEGNKSEPNCDRATQRELQTENASSASGCAPADLGYELPRENVVGANKRPIVDVIQDNGQGPCIQSSLQATHTIALIVRKKVKPIDKRKTIIRVIIRNDKVFQAVTTFYRHWVVTLTFVIIWVLLSVLFVFACFGVALIDNYAYMAIQLCFTSNFLVFYSVFIRVDILKELSGSFNFWFTLWNIVSFHFWFFLLWGKSMQVLCACLHSFSTLLVMVIYDAHAGKHNLSMRLSPLIGMPVFSSVMYILVFRSVDFHTEKIFFPESYVEIVDIRLQAIDNLTTVWIYLFRIFFNHTIMRRHSTITFLSEFYLIDSSQKSAQDIRNIPLEIGLDAIIPSGSIDSEVDKRQRDEGSSADKQREMAQASKIEAISGPHNQNMQYQDNANQHFIGIFEDKVVSYNCRRTLFHEVIVQKYRKIATVLKSKQYRVFTLFIYVSSAFLSLPIAVGFDFGLIFLHASLIISGLGILLLVTQLLISSNITMAQCMIRSFDYWFLMFLITKIFLCTGFICSWDIRMIFWVYSILSLNMFIMVDCFSIKSRKLSYLSLIQTFFALGVFVLCKLKIGKTFEQDVLLEYDGKEIMSSRATLTTSLLSVSLFLTRFFWSYHKQPNRILFMTENMQVGPIPPHS